MKRNVRFSLILVLVLATLLAGCELLTPAGDPTPVPVLTPIVDVPTPTATIEAPTPQPATPTLEPTSSPAGAPAEPTATATTAPLTATATTAPTTGGTNQRISFATGASSAVVEGVVHAGEQARYTLWVQAGQTIQLRLGSLEDSATMMILDPAGNTLNPGGGGPGTVYQSTQWTGPAATSGDYQIVVSALQGSATYRLEVYIPPLTTGDDTATERVQFERGMSGITLSGSLPDGLSKSFVLRAFQDQWLSVSVYAPTNTPFLTISGEDGTVFVRDVLGQTGWYIPALPRTQDYTITVVAANGPADYTLDIGLNALSDQPTRIEFATGSTSATLIDRLAAGGDAEYYIFRALAGQTVTVSGGPTGDILFLYLRSADGSAFFGDTGSLSATLPATGDYVLTVGSPNAAGTIDYTLTLTIE
jgi:hypothetical protein